MQISKNIEKANISLLKNPTNIYRITGVQVYFTNI